MRLPLLAWPVLAEIGLLCLRAAQYWDPSAYGESIALGVGAVFLWPGFRLLTERRPPAIAMGAVFLGNMLWVLLLPFSPDSGGLAFALLMVNFAALCLLVLVKAPRQVLRVLRRPNISDADSEA